MKFALALLLAVVASGEAANMTYLDNGHIRLGVDLDMGGAITYLAEAGGSNMINSWDHGRQVQLSFYSGPVPFQPPGATLDPAWKELGWNPIQAGDAFGHGSRITEWKNNGRTIHVRCVPLIWPLKNVAAECIFDSIYKLSGNVVEVKNKLVNARSDANQYPGRMQELPAVYSNGTWYKLVSYTGNAPFTGGATTTLVDLRDGKGWPWISFDAKEHWAALFDSNDHGIGVFEPDSFRFSGGFAGKPKGRGGPHNDQTGYIAPNLEEILDHNITYEFRYALIVGGVDDIRRYARVHSKLQSVPRWVFKSDRQHWICRNTTDAGWPINKEWRVNLGPADATLLSPQTFWTAEEAPVFQMEAAFDAGNNVVLTIPPIANGLKIPIISDGKFHRYETNLASFSGYEGTMTRLKMTLPEGSGMAKFREIEFRSN